jgi:hypothetical protein
MIDMSWCKCGPNGICPICKVLLFVTLAVVAGAIGFFIARKR